MPEPITVLLVDDHALVRKGVRGFLETQPDMLVVAEAGTGQEAVRLAIEYAPDVVLMDLLMPGMDGVETTRQSDRPDIVSRRRAYLSGHPRRCPLVLAQRRGVGRAGHSRAQSRSGEAILHPRIAARVVQEVHGGRASTLNPFHELSEREMEVLRLVAGGVSNGDIANRLSISEKTVKSHVGNILSKLHLVDRTQAAVYAWREGIVHRE